MSETEASFPKQFHLLQRCDFVALTSSKLLISGRLFLVAWQFNEYGYPRLGITASRKSGSAVVRNRIKRCVREYFRHHRHILPGVDINVIVRRQAAENSTVALFLELQRAFQQIGSSTCCREFS